MRMAILTLLEDLPIGSGAEGTIAGREIKSVEISRVWTNWR